MNDAKRIMVVDDDADVRFGIARLLEKAGYIVDQSADGEATLQAIQQCQPDLLLLDRDMPGLDGLEVCRRIKQNPAYADMAIIMISGIYAESVNQAEGLEVGADGYIARPITNRELLARVQAHIRILSLTRELQSKIKDLEMANSAAKNGVLATLNLLEDAVAARDHMQAVSELLQQEITERKKLEFALQKSEEKYRSIFDQSVTGIYLHDIEGRIFDVNTVACSQLKYSRDELLNMNVFDLHPQKTDTVNLPNEEILRQWSQWQPGHRGLFEGEHQCKDGSIIQVNISSGPVLYDKDKLILAMVQDISERKKAEEEIKVDAERYNALIESTQDWIWVVDSENFNLILFNSSVASYFEKNHGVILRSGMTPDEMFSVQRRDQWKGFYEKTKYEGRFSKDYKTVSENLSFMLSLARLIIDEKIVGISVFAKNITNEMKYLNQLEMSNKALVNRLQQSIKVISKIGEIRDVYTAGHQKRVAELACAIAREMRLSDETINNISDGALVHDIGKIYVASDILNKPGKISSLEFQIIQTHVDYSYSIVKDIDLPVSVKEMIHQHHERLDGTGYPDKLAGDQINIEGRILAVADVVEAMSSHRPYRPALGIDVALAEISKYRSEKFDCDVVDACIRLFRENGFEFLD